MKQNLLKNKSVIFKKLSVLFLLCVVLTAYGQRNQGFQYSGVVEIKTSEGARGTGFFINPDTLVTAFHVVVFDKSTGSVKDNIFVNKGRRLIPVTEIVALSGEYDIAVLRIEDYESEIFYPVSVSAIKKNIDLDKITVFGFPGSNLVALKGVVTGGTNYDYEGSDSFIGFIHDRYPITKGMSGGPVFSSDNSLSGVYIEGRMMNSGGPVGLDIFTSVSKLQQLLQKPSLSCLGFGISCIREELQTLISQAEAGNRQAQYKLGMIAGNVSFIEYKKKWFWFEKAAKNGHPNAQFLLGRFKWYFGGEDMYWLRKSAFQGHTPAQNFLEKALQGTFKPHITAAQLCKISPKKCKTFLPNRDELDGTSESF